MADQEIETADALVQLAHLVQRVFAEVSRDHGLTPQQAQMLCRLHPGPVRMAELSRALHLEKSSLTGLVDRVEARGLVSRRRDAGDRRACQVELTADGALAAGACHMEVSARLEALVDELPTGRRATLLSGVSEILRRAGGD
ncbi:MAG TPA: MarR family transcriptional regulator [Candidatus Dormibacteraeota bacterium]|jgi:DNA-binding MarR family transcriptional regulator|nr:MarR family transcriptional regulator [Candidatus Dormibacteraeota bacterium]